MKLFKKFAKNKAGVPQVAPAAEVASAKVAYKQDGFVPVFYDATGEAVPCAVDRHGWIVGTGRRVLYAATAAACQSINEQVAALAALAAQGDWSAHDVTSRAVAVANAALATDLDYEIVNVSEVEFFPADSPKRLRGSTWYYNGYVTLLEEAAGFLPAVERAERADVTRGGGVQTAIVAAFSPNLGPMMVAVKFSGGRKVAVTETGTGSMVEDGISIEFPLFEVSTSTVDETATLEWARRIHHVVELTADSAIVAVGDDRDLYVVSIELGRQILAYEAANQAAGNS